MTSPLANQVEKALAEFQKQKAAISELESSLNGTFSTATSKKRELAVTVNNQGAVTEIKFPTSAYRTMSGAELGELLVTTIASAREEAVRKTVAAFEAVMPSRLPMVDLFTGRTAPDQARLPLEDLIDEVVRGSVPGTGEKI